MRTVRETRSNGGASLDFGDAGSFEQRSVTDLGRIACGDSLDVLGSFEDDSVDLIVTSPPYSLTSGKEYGNLPEAEWLDWFRPLAAEFLRVLLDSGSLVVELGGSWAKGQPTRSLYQFKALIMLVEELGFHLAQDFYWWNPIRMPRTHSWSSPEGRRSRAKDAVNVVWWLSKTPWPKANNRNVLWPYSESMVQTRLQSFLPARRTYPSGCSVAGGRWTDYGGAVPSNLIAAPSGGNDRYILRCKERGLKVHPARFPVALPEFFVRFLTDPGDLVVDPFGGSCTAGEAAERHGRRWVCIEKDRRYIDGALTRFEGGVERLEPSGKWYRAPHPNTMRSAEMRLPAPNSNGQLPLFSSPIM